MSLIVKLTKNGQTEEYLFNKAGPIFIGSDIKCDLPLEGFELEARVLEIKLSGGNLFIKEVGHRGRILLGSSILPFREDIRYREGDTISLGDTNIQLSVHKGSVLDMIEPPPFFENDFRERLDRVNLRISEKELELKQLETIEEKRKRQITEVEDKYHHHAQEKIKLESEVLSLKSDKENLSKDLRKTVALQQETEEKVVQFKDHVKNLETEEKHLKDNIVAQTIVLSNLRDELTIRSGNVEEQRQLLASLEIDTIKAREELKNIKEESEVQNREMTHETLRVEKILAHSEDAVREEQKIKKHMAFTLKEKALLDHEVKDLQENLSKLETTQRESQSRILSLKTGIEHEEQKTNKLKNEIDRQKEEEENLRQINSELRAELVKVEEKLSTKKNQLNSAEFQNQDTIRKLSSINFEMERSALRLRELQNEEKSQALKVEALRDEFNTYSNRLNEDKKFLHKNIDEEKLKLSGELNSLRREIDYAQKNLQEIESKKDLTELSLDEDLEKERLLKKEKLALENLVIDLRNQKAHVDGQLGDLKSETSRLLGERDKAQRELNTYRLKLQECETQIKENLEQARVELESLKREERARLMAEKDVHLAEVEAFRQKSLIEVENEYRRKEDDVHQKKLCALKEADEILTLARSKEKEITEEASYRLKQATLDAQEREISSHNRIREAQEYFKTKETEADHIVHKARMESRDLLKKTEQDLLDDLAKRKLKVKKFLTQKQEHGLAAMNQMAELHSAKLRRTEEKALEKLEDLKRRELKKVAKLREDELTRQHDLKQVVLNEVKSHKEKAFKDISEQKRVQEAELAEKKKSMLEHINQSKFSSQKNWEDELKREKEQFQRTKKDRIQNATQAVMNVLISELGPLGERDPEIREKFKITLEMAIDGQNANALKEVDQILDFNPTKRKKVIPVLKKYTLRFGVPAAIALVLLGDIGNARTGLVSIVQNLLKQQQSASEIYVNQQKTEWKEKNTYNPDTTIGYKPSYVENMIYTTDFENVMENEEFQNDWILKVHDFIVKDLELSEDVAISFISSEGTLIKDLSAARKDLHPQFLDKGLAKMNELEVTHLGWMDQKIPDPAKKEKFAGFRKDYYEKFYNEKFLPARNLASEPKNP